MTDPVCCTGNCRQGDDCPLYCEGNDKTRTWLLGIFDGICWVLAAVMVVVLIYMCDIFDAVLGVSS